MKQVMTPPVRKLIFLRPEVREIVGGRNYVGADIDVQRRQQNRQQRDHDRDGRMKAAEQLHRIPDGGAVDHDRGRGDRDSDERIQRHRRGQGERLADHLLALIAGEAGEVGDVQRDRGPESDRAIQSGNQKFQEVGKAREPRRHREHGPEAAGGVIGPAQQQQSDAQQNRRADSLQNADVFDAFENDREIDQPEDEESRSRCREENSLQPGARIASSVLMASPPIQV